MFTRIRLITLILIGTFFITGCQEDLFPSNDQLETPWIGKTVDDLSFTLTTEETDTFSARLQNSDAIVLYFTMWCPICESHMSKIRKNFKNQYNNVDFIYVDYIGGSISDVLETQNANNYSSSDVIADYDDHLEHYFGGTMASTIVIDKNFIVLMNEEFKTGGQLTSILDNL